jgi:crotonobetainyl-CoA:carnitine CoA-transferase CaiB-like acyl-CoA transferase
VPRVVSRGAPRRLREELIAVWDTVFATRPYAEWHRVFEAHGVWHTKMQRFEDRMQDEQV